MQQDDQQRAPTPLRKAAMRGILYLLVFPGLALVFLGLLLHGRFTHPSLTLFGFSSGDYLLAGMMPFAVGIAILMLMQKISPLPVDAARSLYLQGSVAIALRARRSSRMKMLLVLVPMLLLSLPIWYVLKIIQPDTPMLRHLRSADLQRLALGGGLILTLVGYGVQWLLRRGDSGNG